MEASLLSLNVCLPISHDIVSTSVDPDNKVSYFTLSQQSSLCLLSIGRIPVPLAFGIVHSTTFFLYLHVYINHKYRIFKHSSSLSTHHHKAPIVLRFKHLFHCWYTNKHMCLNSRAHVHMHAYYAAQIIV